MSCGDKRKMIRLVLLASVTFVASVLLAIGVISYYFFPFDGDVETVTVPHYIGLCADDICSGGAFDIEKVFVESDVAERGTVIGQSPYVGAKRKISRKKGRCGVTLTVSLGKATATVPSVIGMSAHSAAAKLREREFLVRVVPIYTDCEGDGTVIDCEPAQNIQADRGSLVMLYVARKRHTTSVSVPSCIGLSQEDAYQIILSSGLHIGEVELEHISNMPSGTVISQSLKPNIYVRYGTYIDITVSSDTNTDVGEETDGKIDKNQTDSGLSRFFGYIIGRRQS